MKRRQPLRLNPPASDASITQVTGLYRSAEARMLEARAALTLPVGTLMQRAGSSVAALARALRPHVRHMLVLAGPGNNGGDGFEAAWRLQAAGVVVEVWWLGDEERLPADASDALARARAAGLDIRPTSFGVCGSAAADTAAQQRRAVYARTDLVIDALLGRGLTRPVRGAIGQLIDELNDQALDVLAVDLPSGLPGDTGWLAAVPPDGQAPPCVRARWTLALLSPAPGLWMAHGRDHAGDIWFDDLDVAPQAQAPAAWLGHAASPGRRSTRQHVGHKGSFGDVRVAGGAQGMSGAATLAARAALQAGAGRVFIHGLAPDAGTPDPWTPELMSATPAPCAVDQAPGLSSPQSGQAAAPPPWTAATVVAGCGGGAAITAVLPELIAHSARLVLDADALNAVAADEALRSAVRARQGSGQATVITPHPLEAARLLRCEVGQVQTDRLASAQALADALQCALVLKGSGSVITAPGCTPCINPSGNAALATAGSGDVLAGWLAGLWSQVPRRTSVAEAHPAAGVDWAALQALCLRAVWAHGRNAELSSPQGQALPASRQIDALGERLRAGQF
ncbi:MAG: hypothetical protein RIQ60_1072 [Pseudomonadota bacterium]|jgi:hydroxyethylthiazole kinase-like uncharacterized protein yjeF